MKIHFAYIVKLGLDSFSMAVILVMCGFVLAHMLHQMPFLIQLLSIYVGLRPALKEQGMLPLQWLTVFI